MDSSARGEAREGCVEVHGVELTARPLVVAGLSVVLVATLTHFLAFAFGLGSYFPSLEPFSMVSLLLSALATWGLFAHLQERVLAARRPITLRVDRSGLGITPVDAAAGGASETLARADLVDGYFLPRTGATQTGTLRLLRRMRRSRFEAEIATTDARAALTALGLDAASHRATFGASSLALATLVRQVLVVCLVPNLTALPYGLFAIVPLLLLLAWPAKIVVGTDGFLVSWYGWKRFVPMTRVVSVDEHEQRAIALTLIDGKRLIWYTGARLKNTTPTQIGHRDAVLLRMREALALARTRLGAGRVAETVGRAGRSYPEWLAALTELRDGAGYRTAAISRDELWRLLEDPAAADDARAGAAYLLRAGSAVDEIARLRDAAEATVSPRLRVVLDSIVDGSDEAWLEVPDAEPSKNARRHPSR